MNLGTVRILVVGAGVAGLALSRALYRHGCVPDVIERTAHWADIGTGMYLPGNAVRALRALELGAAVEKRCARIQSQRFCDHRGRLINEIDLDSVWRETGPCIGVHRADLHAALREWPEAPPIRMGLTLTSLAQAADRVTAHLSDGSHESYDLVVGSDGIRSSVRSLVFGDGFLRSLGQWGWRFVLPDLPHITTWSVQMSRRSACLTVPIGEGRVYCYVDLMGAAPATSTASADERLDEVLAEFSELPAGLNDVTRDSASRHAAAIEEVALDGWSKGRVLLIGDAAHATGPNMAQGAAMAIEDALILTRCLCEGSTVEACLLAYEALRRQRVDWVWRMTHRRDRIRRLHPTLRNAVLSAFGRGVYRSHYQPLLAGP